ncbi:hypothetical protein, partial [Escherichia coli]
MATPNPLEPVKGAGTTLWVYNGKGLSVLHILRCRELLTR